MQIHRRKSTTPAKTQTNEKRMCEKMERRRVEKIGMCHTRTHANIRNIKKNYRRAINTTATKNKNKHKQITS